MSIAGFVKYQRKQLKLTQQQLAEKAGVGLRFVRELEQGKETIQMDKVQQVLSLFGFILTPARQAVDAYEVFWNYFNKAVKITLLNRTEKLGLLIKEVKEAGKIAAWQFIANSNAIAYSKTQKEELLETIRHEDIQSIESQ